MNNSIYAHENLTEVFAFLRYASTFPDYPKDFIPPGLKDPNYVPPYRGNTALAVVITFMILATAVVTARLWVRKYRMKGSWGIDDWFIIPALVSFALSRAPQLTEQVTTIGFAVAQVVTVKKGCVGTHSYDSTFDRLRYSFTVSQNDSGQISLYSINMRL